MANGKNDQARGTELIWQGKYKDEGSLNLPEKVSWPFQTIETVNESKVDREKKQAELFGAKYSGPWRNRLIWGDNKYIMSSLLNEFAGKINLIYIDPPFATGADFSYSVEIQDEEVVKEPSMIEEVAYRDTWGKGMDSYLQMMFERLTIMHQLLSETGSIFVHLDYHVYHYLKIILDGLFGKQNLINEIIWTYHGPGSPGQRKFTRKHDAILWYCKTDKYTFNGDDVRIPYHETTAGKFESEGTGFKGKPADLSKGKIPEDWWYFPIVARIRTEILGFPTQKPQALLERIIKVASNKDDLVGDFFCGSGTTGAVAEKLGRHWVMTDLSRFAIQTTRKRLLQIENCSPFVVQNLGKYERQYWYGNFGSASGEGKRKEYIETILKFYKAEPVKGYQYIHGSKGKSVVHVGELDVPITLDQVGDVLKECEKAKQDKVDILGWEFEMGLDVEIENRNRSTEVKARLLRIPKEVMDPKYEGKAEFYDLGSLKLDVNSKGRDVEIEVENFLIPHLELVKEEEVRKKLTKWQDFIDYWAIDWNYREDTFHNEWQEFKTRQNPKLKLKANSKESAGLKKAYYKDPGKYKILVKVIDIFGNDTTRLVEVNIK